MSETEDELTLEEAVEKASELFEAQLEVLSSLERKRRRQALHNAVTIWNPTN